MTSAYAQLEQIAAREAVLTEIDYTLEWDSETYMPSGVSAIRAGQRGVLAEMKHELITSSHVSELLAQAEGTADSLTPLERRNLQLIRRMHDNAVILPTELVGRQATAMGACLNAWGAAKAADNFELVRAEFGNLVTLQREAADRISQNRGVSRYQAILSKFEPDYSQSSVDHIFAKLGRELPSLVTQITSRQSTPLPLPHVSTAKQRNLVFAIAKMMGFNFDIGRIDTSAHPFTSDMLGDTRMTVRYDEARPLDSITSGYHEGGHGLYYQGLPRDNLRQPVGSHCGPTTHESQSLFFDKFVSRLPESANWLIRQMRNAHWGSSDPALTADNVYAALNHVEPGPIRITSDFVTYTLHIIMRYEIEKDLIEGRLDVAGLPKRWNADMERYLGVTPTGDKQGCLQDIHWYWGLFGYFPTYTLGALTAAQLFEKAGEEIAGMRDSIAKGDMSLVTNWLRDNIHVKGNMLPAPDLLVEVTGRPLSTDSFLRHIRSTYNLAA